MKTTEIMAAIHQMKEQLANCQCQIAVLEDLLTKEGNEALVETPVNEQPEELPAPPAEIIIPEEDDDAPTEEDKADSLLGWQILNDLPDFYHGKAARIELQKPYFDNGQEKLYINKYGITVRVYDSSNNLIGEIKKPFNVLAKYHLPLIKKGINKHKTSSDPHRNWMPYTISLELL